MAKYKKYNTRQVRRFLRAAFPTGSALIELCQDCYPELLYSFSDGMSHRGMVNAIFNRCHNDKALEKLLSSAREILEDEGKEDILEAYAELFPGADDGPTLSPDEWLAQATCAVLAEGQVIGTAWLVSHAGALLTAGHLLGEESAVDEVTVRFAGDVPRVAHKVDWVFEEQRGIDFAVLKLDPPAQRLPLPVSLARSVSGQFRLLGYGRTPDARSTGIGQFVGFHDPQDNPANRLFRLRSGELGVEGYSGGAVFSDELQAVVGIQVGDGHHFDHSSTSNTKTPDVKFPSKPQEKASLEVGEVNEVLTPTKIALPSKAISNYMQLFNERLSFAERAELVQYLLAIPSIADGGRRATVIDELRPEIKTNIRKSEVDKTHVLNIVNTCLQYPGGMQELRDILQFFENDSLSMQQFKQALNRLLPRGLGFGPNNDQGTQVSATKTRMDAGRDSVFAMPLYRVAQYWTPLARLAQ